MNDLLSNDPKFAAVLPQLAKLTNFQMMAMLNDLAGNKTNGGWDAIKSQLKLVKDELQELSDGIDEFDIHELRDGIADVLVTIYGLAHRAGVDADADLREVVLSNLTKFDPVDATGVDVQATVKKYLDIGVETVQLVAPNPVGEGELYVSKSAFDQVGSDGKRYNGGKWLKSANFQEPVFPLLPFEVRVKLAQETIHWDLEPGQAFGTFVENLPERGGYVVRAIATVIISDELTVDLGDLVFIKDPDQSAALASGETLLSVVELDAKIEALGEIEEPQSFIPAPLPEHLPVTEATTNEA